MNESVFINDHIRRFVYEFQKRAFDFLFGGMGLLLLFPLMVLIGIFIKMDSPGPVFYMPIRTGRYGKPFRMIKFRTMITDADNCGGPTTAKNDPRITKVGQYLRKYKLDEFPQLINVFVGQMSLVGPRPEVYDYTSLYEGEEKLILTVKPGITDYSSLEFRNLQAHVGETEAEVNFQRHVLPIKNELRVKYVKERSFSTDTRILFETVRAVLFRN